MHRWLRILLVGTTVVVVWANAARAASVVCIDPGHPSETSSGDALQNGLREVEVNWQVAICLAEDLRQAGMEVVMTKSAAREYVTNRRRAEIANAAGAALMIRLHCDTGAGTGITFYFPDRQGVKEGVKGPSQSVISRSREAAERIRSAVAAQGLALRDNGVKPDTATAVGSKQGALTGSIFAKVPVVTVEMGFLTNLRDARYLASETGQSQVSAALAAGIVRFLGPPTHADGGAGPNRNPARSRVLEDVGARGDGTARQPPGRDAAQGPQQPGNEGASSRAVAVGLVVFLLSFAAMVWAWRRASASSGRRR